MSEIKVNHGITRPIKSLDVRDVDALRDRIRIGDKYRCPRLVKDTNGDIIERWDKMTVTKKYPHLVTVSGPGPKYPIKTITYIDILTDKRYTANL